MCISVLLLYIYAVYILNLINLIFQLRLDYEKSTEFLLKLLWLQMLPCISAYQWDQIQITVNPKCGPG